MKNHLVEIVVHSNSVTDLDENTICNPALNYVKNFHVSSIFDCSREMRNYSGDYDYHSLMHNVQKPVLALNKVAAQSLFANKLLLREWTKGLVPFKKHLVSVHYWMRSQK